DLVRSTMKSLKQVLEDADLNVNDIDEIVLNRGSIKVQQLVKDFLGLGQIYRDASVVRCRPQHE
ncbi:78 kDa glucose-regulated protein, partial [Elysia marginata]